MKTHLIVAIFEMHILYRNGCQNNTRIGGGGGGGGSYQGPKWGWGGGRIVKLSKTFLGS